MVLAGLSASPGRVTAQQPEAKAAPAEIDPKAIEALKSMGSQLRALKAFALRSETTIDEILDNGQKVQFGGTVDYRVRRPNGLRLEIVSDRRHRQYYFNGKTLTQYGPTMKYYASVAAPPTLAELVQVLDQKCGLEMPLSDLFLWGTDKDGINDIKSASYIGPSRIAGADCDHYAFRQQDVDWQIWIERGKTTLPRKLVITTTSEPAQPQYVALLKWDLAPKLDDRTFTFVPPKDAHKIEMTSASAAAGKNKLEACHEETDYA